MANILGFTFKKTKSNVRSQTILIRTTDGRSVERDVSTEVGAAVDDDLVAGWLIEGSNQYKAKRSGKMVQLVDEQCTVPFCLIDPKAVSSLVSQSPKPINETQETTIESLLQGIYENSVVIALATLDRMEQARQEKDRFTIMFMIAVAVVSIAIAIKIF